MRQLQPERQQLACSLLIVSGETLPRGGRITLAARGDCIAVEVAGEGAGLSQASVSALTLATPVEALTSREIGAYFAGVLAEGLGQRLVAAIEPGRFRIVSEPTG
jgi:hypothetical protein